MFDNEIRIAKQQSIFDFTPTTWTAISSSFAEGLRFNPTSSLLRMEDLRRAQVGDKVGFPMTAARAEFWDPTEMINQPPPKKMPKAEADAIVSENGLKLEIPNSGITKEALDILIERKKQEIEFQFQNQASPEGVIPTVSKFGAQIAAGLMDPLNIASAFIPIVSGSRYAAMLAKASSPVGRAGVRAGVGTVEGVLGAALLEPIVYFASQQEQADYTMMDSVLNVLVGGVMGAGLHAGAGAIGDAIKAGRSGRVAESTGGTAKALDNVPQHTKESLLRAAVAAEASGYRVNVDPIAAFEPSLNPTTRGVIEESGGPAGKKSVMPEGEGPVRINTPAQNNVNEGLASGFQETFSVENMRAADPYSSQQANVRLTEGEQDLDFSIQSITDELNDIAARNNTDFADILTDIEAPVREAELDAKALEAAVLCRVSNT